MTIIDEENKNHENIEQDLYHLLKNKQYERAKELIKNSHIADIAEIIESAEEQKQEAILALFSEDFDPKILIEIPDNIKLIILKTIGKEKFIKKLDLLSLDEIADIIFGFNEKNQRKIISQLSAEKQKFLLEILSYDENSIGRIMSKNAVSIPSYWSIKTSLEHLAQRKHLPDDFYEIFVVDPKHRPLGSILLSRLIREDGTKLVAEVMNRKIKSVKSGDDQEEVALLFKKYNLVSAPVVTSENRLIGQIVIDDIIDIIEKEAEEDIMKIVGIGGGKFVWRSPIFSNVVKRLPWLIINLCTAFITSSVINNFEEIIHKIVILASIMPIVASLSGNAGTQSLTITVRSLASNKINNSNVYKILFKELAISFANSLIISLFGYVLILMIFSDRNLAFVFSSSLIINISLAGLLGLILPITLKKFKFDPALGSGVFLTVVTDIVGFFSFLTIAKMML